MFLHPWKKESPYPNQFIRTRTHGRIAESVAGVQENENGESGTEKTGTETERNVSFERVQCQATAS